MNDMLKIAGGIIIAAVVLFFGSAIFTGVSDQMARNSAVKAAEDACFKEIGSNLALEYKACVERRLRW
ncbi:hypothetical protein [Azospirillum brasilense]|uniref:Uncharacterized protein n=1 Tax=Azospirillum brasilense TaxID=192 RepID=A0A235H565_AZOBR|nr:hypothetical protein [Azospirillum brasilense]OYD80938.1 hypothetical protein CHT98_28485 [Azospirillum brasilense]